MRLLVVEDEVHLLNIIKKRLVKEHYSVDTCEDGEEAMEYIRMTPYDGIILDIMLPGRDGISILKEMRREGNYTPVLLLTARDSIEDRVHGLDMGADDYLVKPFGVMEMVARVKAVLRRTVKEDVSSDITVGKITLKENEHKVTSNGEKVELTHKEFAILKLFMQNPNMVFSRDKLMSEIWGIDYIGETRTVDMHIKTLRHKLGESGGQIKTVIGVGYRLENEV